jgi:pimeloyl-ACP methyl ester carboxylesterase
MTRTGLLGKTCVMVSICFTAALTLAGCSGSSVDESSTPKYAGKGPYAVGVTTLGLGDREAEVWYPADPGATAGHDTTSYVSFEVLPQAIVDILPPELNIEISMDAYRDLTASAGGPFPILTFSHGAGGFRYAYSALLRQVASHGVIVASIDHTEWGLLQQVGLRGDAPNRTAEEVVLATIAALEDAGADSASPLFGVVDATLVANAGHSAGGLAAFALPERPEVRAMIGFATGSARGLITDKPILLLVGAEDGGATRLEESYDELTGPKRFVSVDNAGHNSFTDQCDILWNGNNFLEDLVAAGFPIPENLLSLAIDGCLPENLDPEEFWRITGHFTVAHIRYAFGLDREPVGLGLGIAGAFPGASMIYESED